MASPWIKLKIRPRDRRIRRIVEMTRVPRQILFEKVVEWFWWVDENLDNEATGLSEDTFHDIVGWNTSNGKSLAQSMQDPLVAWLAVDSSTGLLVVPEFEKFFGDSTRRRRTGADKKRKERGQKGDIPSLSLSEFPDWLQKCWAEWIEYRRERAIAPYADIGARKQLNALLGLGEARATAAVNHSMRQNYQGIYEPKDAGMGQPQAKPADMDEAFKIADNARRRLA
jgi:hypothetical protein